jgi:hypothetical protein
MFNCIMCGFVPFLLRLRPQTGSQVGVSGDVKSYSEVSSMEKKTVQRRLKREKILIVTRFGGTCLLRLQVEGHGRNIISMISHLVVCS